MSHTTFQFIYLRQMLRHDTTFQFNFFEANVEKNVATSIPMAITIPYNGGTPWAPASWVVLPKSIAFFGKVLKFDRPYLDN